MFVGVADTHAALWYLYGDSRLSPFARAFLDTAAMSAVKIAVSAITVAEIVYLIDKKHIPANAFDDVTAALTDPNHVFQEAPFTAAIAEALRRLPREEIPDMPDRIVAATAVYLDAPVVSRDGRIRLSNVETVW